MAKYHIGMSLYEAEYGGEFDRLRAAGCLQKVTEGTSVAWRYVGQPRPAARPVKAVKAKARRPSAQMELLALLRKLQPVRSKVLCEMLACNQNRIQALIYQLRRKGHRIVCEKHLFRLAASATEDHETGDRE